jgi:type VI secretion system secreted protein VgrG
MADRLMQISTPLAEDVLLFQGLHAREELSRPFEHQLTLLSAHKDINLDDVLGKSVSVQLGLPNGKHRYFSGYVTRFAQSGMVGRYYRYTATSRPWLWFLTRTADCRIFQEMTVPDIIKKVFADHGTTDVEYKLSGHYHKWTYCVQYRETDFNFVSRLMEQEGIYYYFRHSKGRHTMVLVDSTSAHSSFPDYGTIAYLSPDRVRRMDQEYIDTWDVTREIQPGVYAQNDYDFERPSTALLTKKSVSRKHALADYEIYDFPGEYLQKADGDHYAAVRIDELSTQFELVRATANARGLAVGSTFTLSNQTRDDQNREYLVIGANYDLGFSAYEGLENPDPGSYNCTFSALSTKQQFRPARTTPKPQVTGPQTAVVVGPGGDEIYTDKYGRVKVQFPWDRYGKHNENSSCWVRVSHPWAGKNWGMIAIPRIGQEVIIEFLEGDPDEPIITGRVYNAEQMPPYALPANMTQTGTKTRSSKGGDPSNFNEIRFEDKKGQEQLFIHAEKNQDIEVEHDETHWVGHDRQKSIDHDETTRVKHDRTESVGNNESITIGTNRTESVGNDETISIGRDRTLSAERNESIAIGQNQTIAVGKDQDVTAHNDQSLTVGNDRSTEVAKNDSLTVGKDRKVDVAENRNTSVGKDDKLTVGKQLAMDAAEEIIIKTGDASITMQKDGTITIKGKDITLDGSGDINIKASGNVTIKGSKISQN